MRQLLLAHRRVQADATATKAPVCYILHGLLGSARNWLSFTKSLSQCAAWRFVLLDLRNHGNSHGHASPHTIDACAEDVERFATAHKESLYPSAVIGHSMGGKVLLQLLARGGLTRAREARFRAFVLDSVPGAVRTDHGGGSARMPAPDSVESVLHIVQSAPQPIPDRAWVLRTCAAAGVSRGIAAWLASNVTENAAAATNGGFRWSFDPATAASLYADYLGLDRWDVLRHPPSRTDVHLVVASRSSRWSHPEGVAQLDAAQHEQRARDAAEPDARREGTSGELMDGRFHVHRIDSGHWIHVDAPKPLEQYIAQHLM